MLIWSHFKFKQWLKAVALKSEKMLIEVNEAYTSKTCSWSGQIVNVGSSEYIHDTAAIKMRWDMNGARGIFLRTLAEPPFLDTLQAALVSNANSMLAFSS